VPGMMPAGTSSYDIDNSHRQHAAAGDDLDRLGRALRKRNPLEVPKFHLTSQLRILHDTLC
jgi:hypothetical protein